MRPMRCRDGLCGRRAGRTPNEVARAEPDGHTLLLAASGPMAVNPSLYASMPFNPLTDLAPVIQLSAFPLVLEVHPSLGVKTLAEFLALAKAGGMYVKEKCAAAGEYVFFHDVTQWAVQAMKEDVLHTIKVFSHLE